MLYKDFLHHFDSCPFCEDTNRIIVEKEHAYLTYALAPYHKHHLLVIPKRHIESIKNLTHEEREDIDQLQTLGMNLLKTLQYNSITMLVREGTGEVKSIAHIHFHVVPKIQIGDLDHYGQARRILEPSEVEKTMGELINTMHELEDSTKSSNIL